MLDFNKISKVAEVIDGLTISERNFVGEGMPRVGIHSDLIPYFFAFTALQMCGTGRKTVGEVGCSKIWDRFYDKWCESPSFFAPMSAASLSHAEMMKVFDFSECGFWISDKDLYWRWQLHRHLGCHLLEIPDFSFENVRISSLEGFNYDPFEKKANLLRMILASRPERFINDDQYGPVVDYHVMRVLVRIGVIRMQKTLSTEHVGLVERMLRESAYSAVVKLKNQTGKSHNQLDTLFWSIGRRICRPFKIRCDNCPFDQICKNQSAIEIRVDTINY